MTVPCSLTQIVLRRNSRGVTRGAVLKRQINPNLEEVRELGVGFRVFVPSTE